ncbi:MAG: hypothetical protein ACJ735_17120 [Actinomycetes bacterium]
MRALFVRGIAAASVLVPSVALAAAPSTSGAGVHAARASAPVVITGAQVPLWSRLPAEGVAEPYPSGAATTGDGRRTAHNGTLVVPPDKRTGVDVNQIAAYRWTGRAWQEVPVQVDQRFPYFLANGRSSFSTYSGTDEELTYAWAPDGHDFGEEAWKKIFGQCDARYANSTQEVTEAGSAVAGLGPQETAASYEGPMQDPVPTLDDDDEIAVMARDAGTRAPNGVVPPAGTRNGQAVTITDPLDGARTYVYLFLRPGGSSFSAGNSPYVHMARDANADEWIDRNTFADSDPEKLGASNTGYGPNIPGSVCDASGTVRTSTDRFPRDGVTVTTPTYTLHASGRWMVRSLAVTRPRSTFTYGPDLIARWKGRAFQQSPDSTISLVGFEDEQVNWEANSALLGWRAGPVRAIREIWGADSGTNVTKTETYYRDADVYGYHVRVHPIPPDGLYTSWDYNPGAVTTYYNPRQLNGVPIDGINDENVGNVDQVPVSNTPAEFDSCDPTFDACSAVDRPEEVAGPNGGLVYEFELTGATAAAGNVAAVPYYRDDACLDDGTGDAPVPRPWPGESSTDSRVQQGYVDYWKAHGAPSTLTYADLKCNPGADPATTPPWQRMPFEGAIGQHGVHFFATQDSDNAFGPKSVDELDGQQWRFEVPMSTPSNVLVRYGLNVSAKLAAAAAPFEPLRK